MFEVSVNMNKAWVIRRETLTPYSEGYDAVQVRLQFSTEWESLSKIAVFRAYDAQVDMAVTGSEIQIPYQILRQANVHLMLGLYGQNSQGKIVIPTVWADLGIIQDAPNPTDADNYGPPVPGLYEQMDNLVKQAQQAATDAASAQYAGSVSFSIDGVTVNPLAEDQTGHLIVTATSGGTAVETDLGAVTAYAIAKEGGYTGTYAQFQELLTTNAQTAYQVSQIAATVAGFAEDIESAESAALSAVAEAENATTAVEDLEDVVDTKQSWHKTASVTLVSGQSTWTVNVAGMTADKTVFWGPAPASFDKAAEFSVRMTAQASGTVTFTALDTTDEAITMNLAIFDKEPAT